mmetsp:Transcript_32302/g.76151  ORF Transcript_32302/g.76151 Transcript_32302/m.76151 type:complete len:289 (+) Transcript_32302:1056-1922(+)
MAAAKLISYSFLGAGSALSECLSCCLSSASLARCICAFSSIAAASELSASASRNTGVAPPVMLIAGVIEPAGVAPTRGVIPGVAPETMFGVAAGLMDGVSASKSLLSMRSRALSPPASGVPIALMAATCLTSSMMLVGRRGVRATRWPCCEGCAGVCPPGVYEPSSALVAPMPPSSSASMMAPIFAISSSSRSDTTGAGSTIRARLFTCWGSLTAFTCTTAPGRSSFFLFRNFFWSFFWSCATMSVRRFPSRSLRLTLLSSALGTMEFSPPTSKKPSGALCSNGISAL